jgi:hypothetical protein
MSAGTHLANGAAHAVGSTIANAALATPQGQAAAALAATTVVAAAPVVAAVAIVGSLFVGSIYVGTKLGELIHGK